MSTYKPVPCHIIDEVEILATYKKLARITIRGLNDDFEFEGRIKTWFTRNKVEYLQFLGGVFIPMDKISILNGKKVDDKSCEI